jgi:hypothetical protein
MVTFLPLLVLFFAVGCDKTGYPSQKVLSMTKDDFLALFSFESLRALFDPLAIVGYLAYIFWLVAFTLTLKGDKYPGAKLRNGQTLKYECNGLYPGFESSNCKIVCQRCRSDLLAINRFFCTPLIFFSCHLLRKGPWYCTCSLGL